MERFFDTVDRKVGHAGRKPSAALRQILSVVN
jgi:hypothetical protein